ncbi:MAG: CidA/LrgA family protein [Lachnospiraceae bacterium]
MKYIYQFCIIAMVTFLGEILYKLIPVPIPASVWGLVFMLLFLRMGIIKIEKVKETGEFLINIMPLMFVPAAVGLITTWDRLRAIMIPIMITVVMTTIIVMAVTGKTTQFIMGRQEKKNE